MQFSAVQFFWNIKKGGKSKGKKTLLPLLSMIALTSNQDTGGLWYTYGFFHDKVSSIHSDKLSDTKSSGTVYSPDFNFRSSYKIPYI